MGWLVNTLKYFWKPLVIFLTPVFISPIAIIYRTQEAKWAAVYLSMVVFWMSKTLPLPVTSLIPIFAFPLLGIASSNQVCASYMNESNVFFLGSILVTLAFQQSQLDKRIALSVILKFGHSERSLLASFMAVTALLSTFLNNIVGTTVMFKLASAIVEQLEKEQMISDRKLVIPTITITDFETSKEVGYVNEGLEVEHTSDPHIAEGGYNKMEASRSLAGNASLKENSVCISRHRLKSLLFMAIAFSSNLGGTALMIGSSPNFLLLGILNSYWKNTNLSFLTWMAFNVPGMIFIFLLGCSYLQYSCFGLRKSSNKSSGKEKENVSLQLQAVLKPKYQALGDLSLHEGIVGILFIFHLLLLGFRDPAFVAGWEENAKNIYGNSQLSILYATPVMLIVVILFSIPQSLPTNLISSKAAGDTQFCRRSKSCLTWDFVEDKIPWTTFLTLGGSFALADASSRTQMSFLFASKSSVIKEVPIEIIVLIVTLIAILASNVSSKTVAAAILLPILKDLSIGLNINPLQLMLPVTICCSFDFPFPGKSHFRNSTNHKFNFKPKKLIWIGLVLNVICLTVFNIMINSIGKKLFNLNIPLNGTEFYKG